MERYFTEDREKTLMGRMLVLKSNLYLSRTHHSCSTYSEKPVLNKKPLAILHGGGMLVEGSVAPRGESHVVLW